MQIRQNYVIYANFGLKYRIFRSNMQFFYASHLFLREGRKSCPSSDRFRGGAAPPKYTYGYKEHGYKENTSDVRGRAGSTSKYRARAGPIFKENF